MSKLWLTLVTALCCSAVMSQTSNDQSAGGLPASSAKNNVPSISSFTVNTGSSTAILKWGASFVNEGDYFIVEKSADGVHFETMSAIGNSSFVSDTNFSITDNAIGNGLVYYRIRIAGEQGKYIYSKTISTSLNLVGDFRFYPNPVDKLLIIRSLHPVAVQVLDANGIVWFSQEVASGMQIINVSTLQKGNYILKATDKQTNSILSEQLIKN
jgi:hypothetical protein